MIVFASMLLFHDPVSGLQFFGFSVALGGLVYYQLGGAPAFARYWNAFRAAEGSRTISLASRSPSDLESQSPSREVIEPEMKAEVKAA